MRFRLNIDGIDDDIAQGRSGGALRKVIIGNNAGDNPGLGSSPWKYPQHFILAIDRVAHQDRALRDIGTERVVVAELVPAGVLNRMGEKDRNGIVIT